MALPSLFKRGCDEACDWGWAGEPFLFLSAHCFSSFCPNLISVPMSRHPRNCTCTSESRAGFDAFWLSWCLDLWINSLCTPKRAKSVSCFHFVKRDILGIGTVHGFGPDWVDGRGMACLEWVRKGDLHGSPWENRLTFKLWHPGHNGYKKS